LVLVAHDAQLMIKAKIYNVRRFAIAYNGSGMAKFARTTTLRTIANATRIRIIFATKTNRANLRCFSRHAYVGGWFLAIRKNKRGIPRTPNKVQLLLWNIVPVMFTILLECHCRASNLKGQKIYTNVRQMYAVPIV
jgi:hypothetical protein